ncbi:MAG: aldo/keto reductase [Anaerolineae bacterium]|nr:aldo/keto reductase [Anaerolineae bacterium]
MQYGVVDGVSKPISRVVQGTLVIIQADEQQSFDLFDAAFEAGINTFDTAHVYGYGTVERAVGQWISDRGLRDKVVIVDKGAHHNLDRKRVTPYDITSDLHDSLARLKTDYIDLYILHRDDPTQPVGSIIETLNQHQRAGKIGAFGGSNWSHGRILEANTYAAQHDLTPFAVSSPAFSLAEMIHEPWPGCIGIAGDAGAAARDWYAEQSLAIFAWSSLAGGFMTGRFTPDNLDSFTDVEDRRIIHAYASEANFRRLARAQELAADKDVTLAQIAVAYVLNQPLDIYALIAPVNRAQVAHNIAAAELRLTPDELAWLDLRADTR